MTKNRRMVFLSLLVAQALVLNIIERMLPVPFIAPGAKLGLANIITLVCLYSYGFKDAMLVTILRVILGTLLGGSVSSFLYSISGGILSLIFMFIIMKFGKDNVSTIGVSVTGAFFHNVGQVLMAAIIIQNIRIVSYLPILSVAAIATGIFIGIVGSYLLRFLKRLA